MKGANENAAKHRVDSDADRTVLQQESESFLKDNAGALSAIIYLILDPKGGIVPKIRT